MAATPTRSAPMRRVRSALLLLVVLLALLLALAVAVVPAAVGGSTLTVLSGSMEPTLPVGSVVVVRPRPPAEIGTGDVITFLARDPGSDATRVVTHRVVEVLPGPEFRTRGDANPDPDPGLVAAAGGRGGRGCSRPGV
ncbi:MAG: signal peptidase I, partial [Pseudonocardia sp.]|nr:signal peptidase I [Pseudonocardia sp.]